MNFQLIKQVDEQVARGIEKWGEIDNSPGVLLNAALEELGEVAHAINHTEGTRRTKQEIAEAMERRKPHGN